MTRAPVVVLLACLGAGCYASSGGDPDDDSTDSIADARPDEAADVVPDVVPDVPPDVPDVLPDGSGCLSDAECGTGRFCEFAPGSCAPPGTCTDRGDGSCPEYYSPICGCDGVTYANDCFRLFAGASWRHTGECGVSGCYPGDPHDVCGEGEYCEGPAGVCDLDGPTGWCAFRPVGCDDFYDPVCGCDGHTYSSDCDRQMNGVWLDHPGECGNPCQPGDPYGDCDAGEFCEGAERQCRIMGVAGWCQVPDDSCGWLHDPVCGCDGETYVNDCERQRVGVWRDYWGSCEEPPPAFCGGVYPPCRSGTFCEYPPGDCGYMDGATGDCLEVPTGCPFLYDPVCGCDSRTYDNDCVRQAAGVSLCYTGECGPYGCALD